MKDSTIDKKVLNAVWIAREVEDAACPYFRIEFDLNESELATDLVLDLSALGVVRAWINGFRVGEDELTPGYTDSRKLNYFFRYPVNHLLRKGRNVIGAIVADGWHSGHVGWYGPHVYGKTKSLWCRLQNESKVVIDTNHSGWKWNVGAYLAADLLMGESYDAGRELKGWSVPGYDDQGWNEPVKHHHSGDLLLADHPAIKVTRLRDANRIQTNDQRSIFDSGQNLAGRCWIEAQGPAGTKITMRHAEILDNSGEIYTANLRGAKATDTFTLAGNGKPEFYEPAFTFHGFRYVEVDHPELVKRVGVHATHSDVRFHGWLQCSDSRINQLMANIEWSMRSNFLDVPTDCPQRDERLGWTGDAEVFMPTACLLAHVEKFYSKWLKDFPDAQRSDGAIPPVVPVTPMIDGNTHEVQEGGPAWADAYTICAWHHWTNYKDASLIKEIWPSLARFVEFLHKTSKDGMRCYDGYPGFRGFGDWLAPGPQTDLTLIGTAYYSHSARLAAQLATAIGEDPSMFNQWADDAAAAFAKNCTPNESATQTACILALKFNLISQDQRAMVAKVLADSVKAKGLLTGFIGTAHLCEVLSQNGYDQEAYQVLFHEKWPGWLFPISQGATSMWERWDGWDPIKGFEDAGMNSFNHYAFGAIAQWIYGYMAGIRWDESQPGCQHVILNPRPDPRLEWVTAGTEGVFSSWRYKEGKWNWMVESPVPCLVIPPPGMSLAHGADLIPSAGKEFTPGKYEFVSG